MPLDKGKSAAAVSRNISTLRGEGKSQAQAVAISKSIQRGGKKMPVHTVKERKKKGITRGKGGKITKAKKRNTGHNSGHGKGATFE